MCIPHLHTSHTTANHYFLSKKSKLENSYIWKHLQISTFQNILKLRISISKTKLELNFDCFSIFEKLNFWTENQGFAALCKYTPPCPLKSSCSCSKTLVLFCHSPESLCWKNIFNKSNYKPKKKWETNRDAIENWCNGLSEKKLWNWRISPSNYKVRNGNKLLINVT